MPADVFFRRRICRYVNLEMDYGVDLTARWGPAKVLRFENRGVHPAALHVTG